MLKLKQLLPEIRPMTALAVPVVMAELGWMAMTVVDTMMVGRLSAEAIGAVSFGALFVNVFSFFCLGLLLGLDTVISQAFGARNFDRCNHCLVQGIWIALGVTPLVTLLVFATIPIARNWGVSPICSPIPSPISRRWSGAFSPCCSTWSSAAICRA